jgi:integrase/recombinase XerC
LTSFKEALAYAQKVGELFDRLGHGARSEEIRRRMEEKGLLFRSIQYRFAVWVAASRIEPRISVDSLRHTFGTLLYRATGDLLLVSRALGHRDIRSTQRYAHVAERRLVEVLEGVVAF